MAGKIQLLASPGGRFMLIVGVCLDKINRNEPEFVYTPGNKRVSGYRFRYQLTCPLCTGVFLGNALQLFFGTIDLTTANMSQFLQLGPLDFDPDLGYVRYFWGIDSANNHSHISKPHPLNNTDTLGGRFPWPVI